MKMTKKIMSLAIVFAMVMALAVTSMAAEITVSNALNGETYSAYKIFDVTKNGTAHAYTINNTTGADWFDVVVAYMGATADATTGVYAGKGITLTPSATNANHYVVTIDEAVFNKDAAASFAAYLMANKGSLAADKTADGANGAATITVDDAGYYLVDTTMGSLCALLTTDSQFTLVEKNTKPTIVKTIDVEDVQAQIGDIIDYTITVTDGIGTDSAITVHDTMEAGLTFDKTSVKVNGEAIADVNGATLETATDGCTFHVELDANYVKTLADGAKVVITYTATLNENAEIYNDVNTNTAKLTYQKQESTADAVVTKTYEANIDKVDATTGDALTGAKFRLYDALTGGNEVLLVKEAAGYYRPAYGEETTGVEMEVDTNGEIKIVGLSADEQYYLEETVAPDGYNILPTRVKVEIAADTNVDDMDVENSSGTELPSTGGIGTTIFYALGGLMAVGAGVLLVAKKRMEA